MKKFTVICMLFLLFSSRGSCNDVISKDFYLEDAGKEKLRALPNTLLVRLDVGESFDLSADAYPSGEGSFSWTLGKNNGTVSIFPDGRECTLVANHVGEERVFVHLRGGKSAEIFVRVNPAPYAPVRSFDAEVKEEERGEILAKILGLLLKGLVFSGTALSAFAVISFVMGRRRK